MTAPSRGQGSASAGLAVAADRAAAAAAARPVPSPCVDVCAMGDDGLCRGCRRTLDEIARWSTLDDARKAAVWRALPSRGGGDDAGGLPRR